MLFEWTFIIIYNLKTKLITIIIIKKMYLSFKESWLPPVDLQSNVIYFIIMIFEIYINILRTKFEAKI